MSAGKTGLLVVGLVVLAVGLWYLRAATISRDVAVAADTRTEVVFAVQIRHLDEHTVDEAAESLFQSCRLTVASAVVQRPTVVGSNTYQAVFEPALDRTDRLQLRGCIEDLQIQHVLGDVHSIQRIEQGPQRS